MHNKVLVTGANGLLGSNIVSQLINGGYKVVVLLRKGCNRLALDGGEFEIIEGNITNISDVGNAIEGCSFVIHCAAKTDQTSNIVDFIQPNIYATSCLIMLSKKHNIKRFIYVSTANCFTNGTKINPGNETIGFMPWLIKSGYAYSKFTAQKMILDEFKNNSFPAIVLAPTFLIGSGDAKKSSGKLLLHGLNKRIVFYPSGGKNFINVEFAAEATVNALTKGKTGECYLLAGENLSYAEFFKNVKDLYNPKAILIKIPLGLLIIIANIFSFFEWLFPVSLTFNKTNQRLLCLDNYFSNKKAQVHLTLKSTNTEEAIKRAYTWFKRNDLE